MERTSSEKREAQVALSWEKRLKKARAQREAVLRAQAAAAEGAGQKSRDLKPINSLEMAEKLSFYSSGDLTPRKANKPQSALRNDPAKPDEADARPALRLELEKPIADTRPSAPIKEAPPAVAEPSVAARPAWKRAVYIGLGFCAGIGIGVGVGIVAFQSPFQDGAPLAARQDLAEAPAQDTLADTATALPQPSAQSAPLSPSEPIAETAALDEAEPVAPAQPSTPAEATPDSTSLAPEGPLVLTDLGLDLVRPETSPALIAPAGAGALTAEPVEVAALNAPLLTAVPDAGLPPQVVLPGTVLANRADAPVLQDTAPVPALFNPVDTGADTGRSQLAALGDAYPDATETEGVLPGAGALPDVAPASVSGRASSVGLAQPEVLQSLTAALTAVTPDTRADITLASLDDDLSVLITPDALGRAPEPGVAPAVVMPAPVRAVIPGAANMAMWIFAAATVEDDIVATTQRLVEGYDVPVQAVNRVNYLISRNQVRYYDASTAAAAEQLAAEIDGVARDFTRSGVDPAPGTLEIYLAGEAVAEPSRPIARVPAPARTPAPVRVPRQSEADQLRESVISKLRAGLPR